MGSCSEPVETEETNSEDLQTAQKHYGQKLKDMPALSEASRTTVATWSVFEDFEESLQDLKNRTVPSLTTTTEKLNRQTDSLTKSIPQTLDTPPMQVRLKLLNTRVQLLDQQLKYPRIDSIQLENSLEEMYSAASHLLVEINRTFRKNKIDEELKESEKKELEQQKRFLDSVYQAELNDND
ncbi:MAG: hypothetical protein R3359_04350 [Marinirhabdus sp.]|nr:hypothetical protein [Marinirhabdus sp.]